MSGFRNLKCNDLIKRFLTALMTLILFSILSIRAEPLADINSSLKNSTAGFSEKIQGNNDIPAELKDKIFLLIKPEKKKAYQNEMFPLNIKLYTNKFSIRDIKYPQLIHKDFSVGNFEEPVQNIETVDGVTYSTFEFKTYIFGKRAGNFKLGPARLQCSVLLRSPDEASAFFGSHKTYNLVLKSEEIPIRILPLPSVGRPDNFNGAVGDFDFSIEIHPKEVMVGDPISVKMIIKGEGNFNTVACPVIETKNGFRIYEPTISLKDNIKICESVLIPASENIKEIPMAIFSFFNPKKKIYHTLEKGSIPVKVLSPDTNHAQKRYPEKESFGISQGKGFSFYKNPYSYVILFLILMLVFMFNKRKQKIRDILDEYVHQLNASRKLKTDIREARKAIERWDSTVFYTIIFKIIQEYLGNKFNIYYEGITVDIIDKVLKPKGIHEDILKKIKNLFEECDAVRYASSKSDKAKMEGTLISMKDIINHFKGRKL
jgi:hypothetical protein